MKYYVLLISMILSFSLSAQTPKRILRTDEAHITQLLQLRQVLIDSILIDSTLENADHRTLATALALRQYIDSVLVSEQAADSILFATVYRTDTLAQNIRDEIAALPDENTNIYNTNGTISGFRTVTTTAGSSLLFEQGANSFLTFRTSSLQPILTHDASVNNVTQLGSGSHNGRVRLTPGATLIDRNVSGNIVLAIGDEVSGDIRLETPSRGYIFKAGEDEEGFLDFSNLTNNRGYDFPDKSGTIALLDDIESNTNIYNADGSLTGNRVMTIGSNNLALQNSASASAGRIRLNSSGDLLLRSDEDGATTIVGGTSVDIESTDLINIEADGNLTLESEEDIKLWGNQIIIGGMDDEYVPSGNQHGVFTASGAGSIQRSSWSLAADSLSAYLPDSTIFATVYRTDTLAQNIRDEIAALPDENTNIYNTDGDLIGDREIDLKGYDLTISNGFEDDEAHFNLSNNSTNFWWSGDGQHISIVASGGTFMSGADIYLTAHTSKFNSHILQESSFTSKFRNRVGIGALFSETVAPTVRLHITENSSQNNSALYTTDDILVLENSEFSTTESVNFVLTPAAQGFAGFQVLDRAEETRNRFGYNMLSGDWEVFDFSDNNFMSFNENRLKHTNYGSGDLLTADFTHLLTVNAEGEFSEASWEVVADSISNYIDEDQGFWYDTGFGIATDEYAVMNNAASVIGNFDVSTDGSINFVLNDGDDINTIQMTDGKTTIMTSDTVSIHALKKENETDGLPTNIIAAADGTGTLLRHSIDNLKTALDVNNVFRTVAYADLSAGAADTLATGVFDEYRHLRIIIYVDSISAAERVHLVFNDDHTVENYRGRFTANWGGGTEYLSAEGIRLEQTSHSSSRFIVVDIYNAETMPKLVQTSCVQNGLTSSNTVGTWLNNTEMITSCKLVLSDPAVMQAGTTITVLGMN